MGLGKALFKLFLVGGILTAGLLYYLCPDFSQKYQPAVVKDDYFGKGATTKLPSQLPKDDATIKKFVIKVEDAVLEDLKTRLDKTRYVEPLDNVQFQYGFNGNYLKEVVEYWKTKYEWRKQEKELNKFSQYTTQIEGLTVHFIHQKPTVPKDKKIRVLPLVLFHGWPGSVADFTRILPKLTTPRKDRDYVFEVIVPSIPGFGFSEAPHKTGFDVVDAARIFSKLMNRLELEQYYLQGGDLGSGIAIIMSEMYPERSLGVHLNIGNVPMKMGFYDYVKLVIGYFVPSLFITPGQHSYTLKETYNFLLEESGYFHIQATKPDTVGAGLNDSPAGLAAYILEKFSTETDRAFRDMKDGGLTQKFTMDDLLTNVMLYWISNNIASSMRLYKENLGLMAIRQNNLLGVPDEIPCGIAVFPHDMHMLPRSLLPQNSPNVIRFERLTRGGHFAAMEEPDLLANEIWDFVVDVENHKEKATASRT